MESVKDLLVQFGGHEYAGGFAVSHENIHKLEEALCLACDQIKKETKDNPGKNYDVELKLSDLNWQTERTIEPLAPFGVGNPKPIFFIKDAVIGGIKTFGKQKNHLEVTFTGSSVRAIDFFAGVETYTKKIEVGQKVNVLAHLEKSFFRNMPELRMRIVDII